MRYSAALCRGLIEADAAGRWRRVDGMTSYSAALCRGLIEASRVRTMVRLRNQCIPRLYAAASLKHRGAGATPAIRSDGSIPRLYAAASLKQIEALVGPSDAQPSYSAALCRGLIEASHVRRTCHRPGASGIPRLYAAASLKQDVTSATVHRQGLEQVFRGFMPRPH